MESTRSGNGRIVIYVLYVLHLRRRRRPGQRPPAARHPMLAVRLHQGRQRHAPSLEDRNMAGETATWGPQSSTRYEDSLTCTSVGGATPGLSLSGMARV